MMMLLWVCLAGGVGACCRFALDRAVDRHCRSSLPLGTFVVNVTSCLLLGLLTGWVIGHPWHNQLRTVLGVGLLGGYSTFSTASVEGARLIREGRYRTALVHTGGMLVASIAASAAGLALTLTR